MKPLTRKQQIFVNELLNNPKQSATKAAMVAYNSGPKVAASVASENLRKPNIVSHLQNASELVENTLTDTVREWGHEGNTRRREIAQNAAMYIHDKVHGKATQRVEVQSQAVVLNINMSGGVDQDA